MPKTNSKKNDWKKSVNSFDERRDIAVFPTYDETIQFCINHFINIAQTAIKDRGYFTVALSGGQTPNAIYKALAETEAKDQLDWSKVLLFWSDERCVPPDHKDNNYHSAMESGFNNLPILEDHIFRMCAEKDVQQASKEYEEQIREVIPDEKFDLIMLGMGEDGHTASLFPNSHALHAEGRLVVANFVPQKDTWRMTFTYDCINKAKNIVIYALGEKKAEAVKKVLNSAYNPDELPAQKVGTPKKKALWILDKAAAGNLEL